MKQKTEIDILQKEKSLLEEKLEELNDVNGNLTRKLQEFHRLNDDAENEKLELLSQIGDLEQRISQNEKPVDELTDVGGEETKLEVSECSEPALGKIDITQLELTPDEELRSSVKKDGDVVYDRQGDLVPSVHRKVEELEKKFYIVENQLTEEVNKNKSLKERLQNLQEEKNNADIRCTELKQALEEFIYSTDKRGNKDLHHKSPNGDQQEIDKTIQGKFVIKLYIV